MPFVKLDCGILDSTLWLDRDGRECFLTGLLMAQPREFDAPVAQFKVDSLELTGFIAPPGWYGFVPAAGIAIIQRAGIQDRAAGMAALARLGEPEAESRSPDFEGRRMIRVDGGYLILNFMRYRDRDYTGAERAARYRAKQREDRSVTRDGRDATRDDDSDVTRDATVTSRKQSAEAEYRVQSTEEDVPRGTAEVVFEHWKRVWNHPRAVLDRKRKGRIEARLKDFTVAQLCDAISGFRHSPWHCGTDPKSSGVVYDAIDTLLRDVEQVERGLGLFANPPRAPPAPENATQRILRTLTGTDDSRVIDHDPERKSLTGTS